MSDSTLARSQLWVKDIATPPHLGCCSGFALNRVCSRTPLGYGSENIFYLVHGQWNRSEIDANGRFGAWWADVHYILSSGVNETDLKSALDFFEDKQHIMRNAAI